VTVATTTTGVTLDRDTLEALRRAGGAKLDVQVLRGAIFQRYYDSEFEILALMDTEERQTFSKYLAIAGANWCELVVNSVAERLQVTGFAFGADSDMAWEIWKANAMNADAELVQTDALVVGSGLALAQPDDDNPTGVCITAESPFEATVLYAPGNRRERIAGYKRFSGDTAAYPWPAWLGEPAVGTTEVLILPDWIATWYAGGREPVIEPNPAGLVGLVEIVPQPRTSGPHRSELTSAIRIQDRINTTLFNRLVSTDYTAFRQIWASGVKLARKVMTYTDDQGVQQTSEAFVQPFDVGANRLLTAENPNAKFGSFPGDPLAGFLQAVEQDVDQLAAITQTPAYYFRPMVNLSADAIKAAEAGLVAKVNRRMLHIGEGWESLMTAALAIAGRSGATGDVLWKDPETRSVAQLVDALVKMRTLGVPVEALWAQYGATPAEIEQWRAMRKAEEAGPQEVPPPKAGSTAVLQPAPAGQLAPPPTPAGSRGSVNAPAPTLPLKE
jgi:hypothetical protein